MREDVRSRAPEEACGIIAGKNWHAERLYVITNTLHSATAYRMDAQEQIEVFLEIERENREMLAIYHSHPTGPEVPSETDMAEFAYPGVLTMIWFPKGSDWEYRIFLLENTIIREGEVIIEESE
jgi:proteasome lid subunit RPN8/RPN11